MIQVCSKMVQQELIPEARTTGLEGTGRTQEVLSGEWNDNMKDRVVKRKRHTANNMLFFFPLIPSVKFTAQYAAYMRYPNFVFISQVATK
jgi:hypothetical protein